MSKNLTSETIGSFWVESGGHFDEVNHTATVSTDGLVNYTKAIAGLIVIDMMDRDGGEYMEKFNQLVTAQQHSGKAAIAAINYALNLPGDDVAHFLYLWVSSRFESTRAEWSDIPDDVFLGVDPTFTPTVKPEQDYSV